MQLSFVRSAIPSHGAVKNNRILPAFATTLRYNNSCSVDKHNVGTAKLYPTHKRSGISHTAASCVKRVAISGNNSLSGGILSLVPRTFATQPISFYSTVSFFL